MLDIRSRAGVAITNNKKTVMNGDNDNDESIINCDDKINRANKILVHRRRRRRQLHESINGGGGDSGDTRLPRQFDYIHKDHSYCLLPTTTTRIHVPTVAKMSHRDMETKREDNESDDNDDDDDSGASSSICYYDNYNKKLGNDHKNSRNIIRLSISNSSGVYEREGIVRALCKKFAMNEHTIDREEQEEVKNDPSDLFIDSASSSSSSSSISSNMEELLPGLVRSKIDQFNGVNKETDLRSGITYRYDLNQSTATDVTTATSSSSSSSSTTTASSTTDPDSVSMNYYNNMDFSGENTVSNTSLLDRSDSTLTSSCANSDSYSTHLPNTSPSQLPDHTPSFSSSSFFPSSNSNSQKDSLGLSYFRSRNFEESYVKIKELFSELKRDNEQIEQMLDNIMVKVREASVDLDQKVTLSRMNSNLSENLSKESDTVDGEEIEIENFIMLDNELSFDQDENENEVKNDNDDDFKKEEIKTVSVANYASMQKRQSLGFSTLASPIAYPTAESPQLAKTRQNSIITLIRHKF